ncbi:copper chaperone [Kickxella alabastrina]|uniref:Copper chaperone n=1 Tax=Kickxella alabastrina TaxID=61397 RepID=A0ACC1IR24_9FUNG|nr:copper chaperone [Kickxella alabastrina]
MAIKVQLAVDMTCQSCVDDITQVLSDVPGIQSLNISLPEKRVVVEGNAGPSAILKALKSSGRSAVIRGTGSTAEGTTGAAVCILEQKTPPYTRGLVRFVQISTDTCFVDISVNGVSDGTHRASIRECGDLSDVPGSCGGVWQGASEVGAAGELGELVVRDGWGEACFETGQFAVWDIIGRSVVVSGESSGSGISSGVLAGVVARSAGLFENDKLVCACSGNTVWTEQRLVDQGRLL